MASNNQTKKKRGDIQSGNQCIHRIPIDLILNDRNTGSTKNGQATIPDAKRESWKAISSSHKERTFHKRSRDCVSTHLKERKSEACNLSNIKKSQLSNLATCELSSLVQVTRTKADSHTLQKESSSYLCVPETVSNV